MLLALLVAVGTVSARSLQEQALTSASNVQGVDGSTASVLWDELRKTALQHEAGPGFEVVAMQDDDADMGMPTDSSGEDTGTLPFQNSIERGCSILGMFSPPCTLYWNTVRDASLITAQAFADIMSSIADAVASFVSGGS